MRSRKSCCIESDGPELRFQVLQLSSDLVDRDSPNHVLASPPVCWHDFSSGGVS